MKETWQKEASTLQCRFGLRKNRFKKMGSHSQTDRSVVRTNFCVPLEPRAAGGGSSGTQKLIKQKFLMRVFCPHGPLRKYFRSVFSARTDHYENIFEAETWRNPRENFPPLLLNLLRNVFTQTVGQLGGAINIPYSGLYLT